MLPIPLSAVPREDKSRQHRYTHPRMKSYKDLEPITKQLTIVVGLTVVGFMAFGLVLSFYRNVLFEERLREMRADNELLRGDIEKDRQDLDYYRSSQYKDKYAKENLNKLNRGERVIIITDTTTAQSQSGSLRPTEAQVAAYEELLQQMPVIQHWNLYLFHRDQLEQLKKGL